MTVTDYLKNSMKSRSFMVVIFYLKKIVVNFSVAEGFLLKVLLSKLKE